MSRRTSRPRPAKLRTAKPAAVADPVPSSQAHAVTEEEAAAIAEQLRAQIPGSTDPGRLEELACEAERKAGKRR